MSANLQSVCPFCENENTYVFHYGYPRETINLTCGKCREKFPLIVKKPIMFDFFNCDGCKKQITTADQYKIDKDLGIFHINCYHRKKLNDQLKSNE